MLELKTEATPCHHLLKARNWTALKICLELARLSGRKWLRGQQKLQFLDFFPSLFIMESMNFLRTWGPRKGPKRDQPSSLEQERRKESYPNQNSPLPLLLKCLSALSLSPACI